MNATTRTRLASSFLSLVLPWLCCSAVNARADVWPRQSPPLTGDNLSWATYGLDGFVVSGSGSDALVSSNGLDWTLYPFGLAGPVAYNGDQFFWAGPPGTVLVSTQGYYGFAEFRSLPPGPHPWPARSRGIACVSNTCVIVGERGNIHFSTNSGNSWQPVFFTPELTWQAVCHGPDGFMAISANNTIMRSTNGSQWTVQTNLVITGLFGSVNVGLRSIAFGGGRYVAVSQNAVVVISTNGVSWTGTNVPAPFYPGLAPNLNAVAWIGSTFLAAADDGTLYSSEDGFAWTELPHRVPDMPQAITASPEQTLIVGSGGTVSIATNGQPFRTINGPHFDLQSMAYADGQWLAVGDLVALRSTNGLDWTSIPNLTNDVLLYGVFRAHGKWFVPTSGGTTWVSTNGQQWEALIGQGPRTRRLAQGNGVLVNGYQYISYSTNGLEWYSPDLQQFTQTDVAFSNGRFVAIGTSLLVSTNGVNWTPQSVPTNGTLTAITATPDGFLVAGVNVWPWLARSADGVQWSIETAPFGPVVNTRVTLLAWGRGTYVAVVNGRPMTSQDGRIWQAHYFQGQLRVNTLCFGGGAFLAAGAGETIFRSDYVAPSFGPAVQENGLLSLSLYTEAGETNQLESTTDFEAWNPLASLVATNDVHRIVRPMSDAREFLRVR